MKNGRSLWIVPTAMAGLIVAGIFLYREWWSPIAGYGYGYGRHMMTGMGTWGMGNLMLVFWGLILLGFILLINWLINTNRNPKETGEHGCDAEEILKSRYASGEIDLSQYKKMREELYR